MFRVHYFAAAAQKAGVPLKLLALLDVRLRHRYDARFALIRPDQHVAWRGNALPDNLHTVARIETRSQAHGCYLEVVPNERLVWTDALLPGYRPAENPFMTAIITLESQGKGTRYTAVAIHRDDAGRKKHEDMGFYQGWGKALDQLVAHVKTM